ncbi:MAG: HAMP domain-containing histidine kinase [Flammeovirgaceae bacterium]|nr:HAMP domain-containing histidine kinase [Flammeovirgaceae bacterium]
MQLQKDAAEDMHLSIKTINKRSEGLIRFVKEFRNLSHVQQPKKTDISIKKLFEELTVLHKKEITDNKIIIKTDVDPSDLLVTADKNMIEQVIINLIKNAIQSFDEQSDKKIWLAAYFSKGHTIISVRDNGPGIDPEALEKIFIPFFTTKKSGSGIGLSLSKQIMRQHDGRISVQSKLSEGTDSYSAFNSPKD